MSVDVREADPDTSRDAAGVTSEEIKGRARRILWHLLRKRSYTDEELWADYEALIDCQFAPRITDARMRHCRKDLELAGLITTTGERRTNKSGATARVWIAA